VTAAAELLDAARTVVRRQGLAGARERAAALLARQALEAAVAGTLRARAPGAEGASAHAQLLCLPTYAPTEPALEARYLWSVLSRACHHHPYELAPIPAELDEWIRGVERVAQAIAPATAGREPTPGG
jgi:hypothetical protein